MKNRDIVVMMRPHLDTWAKLQACTLSHVADIFVDEVGTPSAAQVKYIKRWWRGTVKFLKKEFINAQHLAFVNGKIKEVLDDAQTAGVAYMVGQGLSSDTAVEVFLRGVDAWREE